MNSALLYFIVEMAWVRSVLLPTILVNCWVWRSQDWGEC